MINKQWYLILGLIGGVSGVVAEDFKNPLLAQDFLINHPSLAQFNTTWGGKKAGARKLVEQLILVLAHGATELREGKITLNLKKGITIAYDMLQKKAVYSLIDKTVQEVLEKRTVKSAEELEKFNKNYEKNIRPVVGDVSDIVFRGIKYFNDPTKDQTVRGYIQYDIVPHLLKKKIVTMTQRILRTALERSEKGMWVAGAYDLACALPLVGTELEEMPRMTLEWLYDKGVARGKQLHQKIRDSFDPVLRTA